MTPLRQTIPGTQLRVLTHTVLLLCVFTGYKEEMLTKPLITRLLSESGQVT
jgi:hypothetical protein